MVAAFPGSEDFLDQIGAGLPKFGDAADFLNPLREARALAVGLWLYLQARHGMAVLVVKHFL